MPINTRIWRCCPDFSGVPRVGEGRSAGFAPAEGLFVENCIAEAEKTLGEANPGEWTLGNTSPSEGALGDANPGERLAVCGPSWWHALEKPDR